MKVLDLFSGIGGFALGLEAAGFETAAFCEIDPYAQKVLKKNWPGVPIYEDVRRITADRLVSDGVGVDVITGGFPCQDISTAGRQAGIDGERSGLWSECARLLRDIRPRYAIFENVTNLLNGGGEIGLSEFSGTFPRSGMMRNGTVYQLPRLAPTTTEIGSGLWPTPTATANQGAPSMQERYTRPHFYPTPNASTGDTTGNWKPIRPSGQRAQMTLQQYVRIWPTPSASDNRDRGNLSNPSLQRRIKLGKQLMLSQVVHPTSGKLNPTWVEWLMGFPLGHTDLDA